MHKNLQGMELARAAKEFVRVDKVDDQNRPTELSVPGHNFALYTVLLKYNGGVTAECWKHTDIGPVPCEGAIISFCYHIKAALLRYLDNYADYDATFCTKLPIALRVKNLHAGACLKEVKNKHNSKTLQVVRWPTDERKEWEHTTMGGKVDEVKPIIMDDVARATRTPEQLHADAEKWKKEMWGV